MREFDIDKCYSVMNNDLNSQQYVREEVYRKVLLIYISLKVFEKCGLSLTYHHNNREWKNTLYTDSMLCEFDSLFENHINYEIHEVVFIIRMSVHLKYPSKRFSSKYMYLVSTYGSYIRKTRGYKPETVLE